MTDAPRCGRFVSQLRCDQAAALRPDTVSPFLSAADAVKRLSKYHVLQEAPPEPEELAFEDELFRARAEYIYHKRHIMYNKYRRLLLKESMVSSGVGGGGGRGVCFGDVEVRDAEFRLKGPTGPESLSRAFW